jgi:hypothetical protein
MPPRQWEAFFLPLNPSQVCQYTKNLSGWATYHSFHSVFRRHLASGPMQLIFDNLVSSCDVDGGLPEFHPVAL